jgi:hypothetical protein
MAAIEVPDIDGFIVSSLDKKVVIWDSPTLKPRITLEVKSSLHTITFSPTHSVRQFVHWLISV